MSCMIKFLISFKVKQLQKLNNFKYLNIRILDLEYHLIKNF